MPMNNKVNPDKLHIGTIFPTHVLNYVWEDVDDLNEDLKQAILKKETEIEGLQVSNVGGFHSENDVFGWDCPCVKTLHENINKLVGYMANASGLQEGKKIDLSVAGWANIIRNGNYQIMHNHPNNFWSGVYYIDGGDPDTSIPHNGLFEFVDPRAASEMIAVSSMQPARYQVKPKPGLMLLFPSFVHHYVHPFIGTGERMTIAFNVRIV